MTVIVSGSMNVPLQACLVMPGLDPGIQGKNTEQAFLDRRVKPGDDVEEMG
jgi:hypothetical protein